MNIGAILTKEASQRAAPENQHVIHDCVSLFDFPARNSVHVFTVCETREGPRRS